MIVDDHPSFRASARTLLEDEGFRVVGEAIDGRSAVETVRRLRPDVVLLDVLLPDIDGFEVARRIAESPSAPAVVLTSSRDRATYRRRLDAAPARGFIGKAELTGAALAALVQSR